MDYVSKYRLVVATPNSPTRVWSEADDEYLHNIVNFVIEQLGKDTSRPFGWSGTHQGGMTSNRIVRTDFFKDKVDGWLQLSGGRLGGNPGRGATFGPGPGATTGHPRPVRLAVVVRAHLRLGGAAPSGLAATAAAMREPPTNDFSFIYETGQREMDDKGLA